MSRAVLECSIFSENMEQRIMNWLDKERIIMVEPSPQMKNENKNDFQNMKLLNSQLYQRRTNKPKTTQSKDPSDY